MKKTYKVTHAGTGKSLGTKTVKMPKFGRATAKMKMMESL